MQNSSKRPVVLTIAGFDPSGGAGILADIKTIAAFRCYGVAAVSSLTFQNTRQVFGAHNQGAELIRQQITPLLDDFQIAAIKTGMLPTAEVVREVVGIIRTSKVPVVIVDPVLRSTSGFALASEEAIGALIDELFPLADLVTPNLAEAQLLSGLDVKDDLQLNQAGEFFLELGSRAVLITGCDGDTNLAIDFLADAQATTTFSAERITSINTHGTGCTLASALACLLAQGRSLRESVPIAKEYVRQAILSAPGLGQGNGPLNHFPVGCEIEC